MSGHGLRVSDIAPVGERAGDRYRGRVGTNVAGVDSQLGIQMVGTLADGQGWVYDAASNTLIPGDIGPGIDLQDDGVSQVNPATVLNFRTGLTADASGNIDATGGGGTAGGGDYTNVRDYGAVADSSTNNLTAIQAAINATTEYGTLFFPDGLGQTYDISGTLTIPKSIRLLGAGSYPGFAVPASTIRETAANTTAISSTVLAAKIGAEYLGIEGPAGGSSGNGIYSTSDVELFNARINGFYDNVCIDVTGATPSAFYSKITHSWINFATRASIYLKGNVNNGEIVGNHLSDSAYGILADGGMYGFWITHNAIELHSVAGIQIDGTSGGFTASGVSIIGNYFEQSLLHGTPTADLILGPTTAMRGAYVAGNKFVESDVTGLTHIVANKVNGLTLVGNDVGQNAETGSLLCDAANTSNVTIVGGDQFAGLVTTPATTRILDETDVTPSSTGGANAVGTSKYLARADHVHQGTSAASGGTPAVVLGTAAAAGSATTFLRDDDTIVAFDATAPTTQALGDAAATGSVAKAARRDHKHGMPALSTATPLVASGSGATGTALPSSREDHVHPISGGTVGVGTYGLAILDGHSTPLVFADIAQTEAGDDFGYLDG